MSRDPTIPAAPCDGRIAINRWNTPGDEHAVHRITRSGSYYLTGNVVGSAGRSGIVIAASDVTVDLNGYAVVGAPQSISGVLVFGAQRNVVVRNGSVRDWGSVAVDVSTAAAARLEDLQVSSSGSGILGGDGCEVRGCVAQGHRGGGILVGLAARIEACAANFNAGHGLYMLEGSRASRCTSQGNEQDGFYLDGDGCVLRDSVSLANGGRGVTSIYGSTVERVTVEHNLDAGIWSPAGVRVRGCQVAGNGGDGVVVGSGARVEGCLVQNNSGAGIRAASAARLHDNHCVGHTRAPGILVVGTRVRIEANTLVDNVVGLRVTGVQNLITRNSASGNGTGYEVAPGNALGPVLTAQDIPTSCNPHANYEF